MNGDVATTGSPSARSRAAAGATDPKLHRRSRPRRPRPRAGFRWAPALVPPGWKVSRTAPRLDAATGPTALRRVYWRRFLGDEAVAFARDRGDEPGAARVVLQLDAEAADMAVDDVAFGNVVRAP